MYQMHEQFMTGWNIPKLKKIPSNLVENVIGGGAPIIYSKIEKKKQQTKKYKTLQK